MKLEKIIDETLAGGTATYYRDVGNVEEISWQIVHPNSGTFTVAFSNFVGDVNVQTQGTLIPWSLYNFFDPSTSTFDNTISLADAFYVSPCILGVKCGNFKYMRVQVTGTGNYQVYQAIADYRYSFRG